MRTTAILACGVAMAGLVRAGEFMQLDFPLFPRASAVAASGENLQNFTQALGGASASAITSTGDTTKPFSVDGTTFTKLSDAVSRSCSNQHSSCADIANGAGGGGGGGGKATTGVTVNQCDQQQTDCNAQKNSAGSASSVTSSTTTTAASTTTTAAAATSTVATSTTTAAQVFQSEDANFFYICDI